MIVKFAKNKSVAIDVGFSAVPFSKGDVKDLPEKIAKSLIEEKVCEPVKGKRAATGKAKA